MPLRMTSDSDPAIERLRNYQREGVAFLCARPGALLADEMGLGKTVQAGVAVSILRRAAVIRRTLIIAPTALATNWQRELAIWAPSLSTRRVIGSSEDRRLTYALPVAVLIANYHQIRLDVQRILADELSWDLVILDEAQWIKNRHSATNLACRLLRRQRSWALSATPLENRIQDFSAVLDFVAPDRFGKVTTRRDLHAITGELFLRRRKSEVLSELPPLQIQEMALELLPEQRLSYDSRAAAVRSNGSSSDLLAIVTALKQICNFDPSTGVSCKLEVLNDIVRSLTGSQDKLLIFSQYVETLNRLKESLEIETEVYHGGLSASERDNVISRFQDETGPRALLVSIKAGGVGLNLPQASHVVMFDRWWNPAVEMQAIQRAHRFGRTAKLHVVRFCVVDSIEERIVELLHQKEDLFEDVVEDAPSSKDQSHLLRRLLLSSTTHQ